MRPLESGSGIAPMESPRRLAGTDGARRSLNSVEQARIAQAVEAALQCVQARERALTGLG